jgi:two-component system chemotaxis sensor kinase CheA
MQLGYGPGGQVFASPRPSIRRRADPSAARPQLLAHLGALRADVLRQGMDPENFLRFLETVGDIRHLETLADAMPAAAEMDPELCYLGFEIALESAPTSRPSRTSSPSCATNASWPSCRRQQGRDYLDLIRSLPEDTLRLGEILVQVGALTADELAEGCAPNRRPSLRRTEARTADRRDPGRPAGRPARAGRAAVAKQAQVSEKAQDAKLIRVPADKLDHLINLVGELVIAGAATSLLAHTRRDGELIESSSLLTRLVEEIRDASLQLRTVQIGETFNRFHRLVRDACKDLGKDVQLVINGGETELDKSIVEKIGDPLMHLVRNSLDHGIEAPAVREAAGKPQGTLFLNAFHDAGNIVIEVGDDGAGLNRDKILAKAVERGLVDAEAHLSDREVFDLIFAPGLSTAEQVTNLSGRGVGMDVVRRNLQALRGTINVDSQPGQGTRLTLRLPLTLAIIDGFLVVSGNRSYVIPLDAVVECIERPESEHERNYFNLRGQVLPAVCLREIFSLPGERPARESVVVVQYAGQRAGIVVDRLAGELQAVIKPLGAIFRHLQGIGGSTILGSGEVALILDISALIKISGQAEQRLLARPEQRSA